MANQGAGKKKNAPGKPAGRNALVKKSGISKPAGRNALAKKPKAKTEHKRSKTAFGSFNVKKKGGLQGPHTAAHVFTVVGMEKVAASNRDIGVLARSRLVPSPGQVNAILREQLEKEGRLETTKLARERYLRLYTRYYNKMLGAQDRDEQLQYAGRLIELAPQQTYGWAKGSYTPEEIAGKGERRHKAETDFETTKTLKNSPRYRKLTTESKAIAELDRAAREDNFISIDTGGDYGKRQVLRRTVQFSKFESGDPLSEVSEESDLDDILEKDNAGNYSVVSPKKKGSGRSKQSSQKSKSGKGFGPNNLLKRPTNRANNPLKKQPSRLNTLKKTPRPTKALQKPVKSFPLAS
jgi:hypothetical protein